MEFRSVGQVYVDILKARDWFNSVGVRTSGTRLEQMLNYVYELVGKGEPEPPGGRAEQDTYYAMSDGAGFGVIATEFSKLPSHLLPRAALRDALRGPLVFC
jgi:hypothetical protein